MMSLSASLTLIIAPRVHHDAIQSARKKTQSQALGLRIENEKFKIIGSSALNDVWFQGSIAHCHYAVMQYRSPNVVKPERPPKGVTLR